MSQNEYKIFVVVLFCFLHFLLFLTRFFYFLGTKGEKEREREREEKEREREEKEREKEKKKRKKESQ